jgi:hypothetical protein
MAVYLVDDSLSVNIFYSCDDCDYEDNIILRIREDCPDDERLFVNEETNIFLTRDQALKVAELLLAAVHDSREDASPGNGG